MSALQVIIVCGLPRSGTSCVAGVLHHLGIPMGANGGRKNATNPQGYFEDPRLIMIGKAAYDNIWDEKIKTDPRFIIDMLTRWLAKRSADGPVIGGKYPRLSACLPELAAAFPGLKVIKTHRSSFESAESMKLAWARNANIQELASKLQFADDRMHAQMSRLHVLHMAVPYGSLISYTASEVERIIKFCGITPNRHQIHDAVQSVKPSLSHFTKPTHPTLA